MNLYEQFVTYETIGNDARALALSEPFLKSICGFLYESPDIGHALAFFLAQKISRDGTQTSKLFSEFLALYTRYPQAGQYALHDLAAIERHDPAAYSPASSFLFYKGFQALQCYRLSHLLWQEKRFSMALWLQGRVSEQFDVDIHPAAHIGFGNTLDHASGIVIGETSVIGNNVLILHSVTLGTRTFVKGPRHPVIGDNVIIGAGAKILGRINIGDGAYVAAGSLVLKDVAPGHVVAGVPARIISNVKELS